MGMHVAAVRVTQMKVAAMKMAQLQMAEAAEECEHAQHQAHAKTDEIPVLRTQ
jgi:hypothetical protein